MVKHEKLAILDVCVFVFVFFSLRRTNTLPMFYWVSTIMTHREGKEAKPGLGAGGGFITGFFVQVR